jgi:hypothetical protein
MTEKRKNRRHGLSGTYFERVWKGMVSRCYRKKDKEYLRYGGRGITVCERWRVGDGVRNGLEVFAAEMGPRPSGTHTLDRKDNDQGYDLANCRWATPSEQAQNRRSSHLDSGETLTEIADRMGASYRMIQSRWNRGLMGADLRRPARSDLCVDGIVMHAFAKEHGVSYQTLFNRYRRGLRGGELWKLREQPK